MPKHLIRVLALAVAIVSCTPAAADAPSITTPDTTALPATVTTVRRSGPTFSVDQALGSAAARIEAATIMHRAVEQRDVEQRLAEIAAAKAEAERRLDRLQSVSPPPAPAPTPTDAPAVNVAPDPGSVALPAIMLEIRRCESGGDYTARNPTSSASGAWQFIDSTWRAYGDPRWPRAYLAPPEVQDAAAMRLYNASGTSPWRWSQSCWG